MTVVAFHRLEVEGLTQELGVIRWRCHAALHAPFELEVLVRGRPAGLELGAGAKLHLAVDEAAHALGGVIERAEATLEGTVITLAPPVARLGRCRAHRVVLDVDGLALAQRVLSDHGIAVEIRCPSPPAPRPQRVQGFESELGFAARLLTEEGICWFADQDGEGETSVVFADGPSAFSAIVGDGALPYHPDAGLRAGEAIATVRLSSRWTIDRVQVRDYAFDKPELDLSAEVGKGPHGAYRFVGPGWYADPSAGKALAERLLDVERREAVVLEATSSCHRLWPGRVFELTDAPRDDLNRRWLVIEATLVGREYEPDAPRIEVTFRAVPADVPWRPTVAPAPTLGGVQTATITGPAGQEIHTDEHGRVRAKLRYDVDKPADDKASAWSRVLHPPTSGGFLLPRTGWEALVAFTGQSGDEPYVLGRLDNGAAPTAEALPGKQVCSNFGTPTTPGRGAPNMVRMTDTAGSEDMGLVASRDWNEQTAANKALSIKGSLTQSVGVNQSITVGAARGLKIDATKTSSVGGNRTLTAATGIVTEAGSEIISVGGTRSFEVGGDQPTTVGGALNRTVGGAKVLVAIAGNNRHVDATSTMVVGGAWLETGATASMTVAGVATLTSSATAIEAGKYSLEASALSEVTGSRTESAPNVGYQAGGALALTFAATSVSASTVVIKGSSITVTAGGGVLSVSPGSVKFVGLLEAGGHVRSGGNAKHG
jgi:type VI secretion system secreted protein VgrG